MEAYFGCADGAKRGVRRGRRRRTRRARQIEARRRGAVPAARVPAAPRDLGWQLQMLQHAPNDGGIVDECDQGEPPATAGQARTSRPKLRRISSAQR